MDGASREGRPYNDDLSDVTSSVSSSEINTSDISTPPDSSDDETSVTTLAASLSPAPPGELATVRHSHISASSSRVSDEEEEVEESRGGGSASDDESDVTTHSHSSRESSLSGRSGESRRSSDDGNGESGQSRSPSPRGPALAGGRVRDQYRSSARRTNNKSNLNNDYDYDNHDDGYDDESDSSLTVSRESRSAKSKGSFVDDEDDDEDYGEIVDLAKVHTVVGDGLTKEERARKLESIRALEDYFIDADDGEISTDDDEFVEDDIDEAMLNTKNDNALFNQLLFAMEEEDDEIFQEEIVVRRKDYVHNLFSNPQAGPLATFITTSIIFLIVLSTILFVAQSLPVFQPDFPPHTPFSEFRKTSWFILEALCTISFTIEYIARFVTCQHYFRFVFEALNIIDLVAILPFWIELGVYHAEDSGDVPGFTVVRVVRLVRILRILKITRYGQSTKMLFSAVAKSVLAAYLLVFYLSLGVLFFSSLIFYAEQSGEFQFEGVWYYEDGSTSPYQSIPHSMWWAIVTMTTVGYGDESPGTPAGFVVATMAMLVGIVAISFPAAILGQQFLSTYMDAKRQQRNAKNAQQKLAQMFADTGQNVAEMTAMLKDSEALSVDDEAEPDATDKYCPLPVRIMKERANQLQAALEKLSTTTDLVVDYQREVEQSLLLFKPVGRKSQKRPWFLRAEDLPHDHGLGTSARMTTDDTSSSSSNSISSV